MCWPDSCRSGCGQGQGPQVPGLPSQGSREAPCALRVVAGPRQSPGSRSQVPTCKDRPAGCLQKGPHPAAPLGEHSPDQSPGPVSRAAQLGWAKASPNRALTRKPGQPVCAPGRSPLFLVCTDCRSLPTKPQHRPAESSRPGAPTPGSIPTYRETVETEELGYMSFLLALEILQSYNLC